MTEPTGKRRQYSLASGAVALQIIALVFSGVPMSMLRVAPWSDSIVWGFYVMFATGVAACIFGFWLAVRGWNQAKLMATLAMFMGVMFMVANSRTFGW